MCSNLYILHLQDIFDHQCVDKHKRCIRVDFHCCIILHVYAQEICMHRFDRGDVLKAACKLESWTPLNLPFNSTFHTLPLFYLHMWIYIHTWKLCDSGNQPFFLYLTCAYSNFFLSTHIPTSLSCTAMCIHRRGHFPWRADTNPCGPSNSHFGASIVRWASYYKKCPYEAGTLSGRYSREVVFFDLLKSYLSLQLGHYCNDK